MSKYNCERCGKEFGQKSHYDSHKNRKTQCPNLLDKMKQEMAISGTDTINKNNKNMSTFIDLYKFLQNYGGDSILPWLEDAWVGKDKQ